MGTKRVLAALLALLVGHGCSGSSGSGDRERATRPRTSAERAELQRYEAAAQDLVFEANALVQQLAALQSGLDGEDDVQVDGALAELPAALDRLEATSDRLASAENALEGAQYGDEPEVVRAGLAFLPVLATLAGLASFAEFLREKNAEMDMQRMQRDQACAGIADDEPGAIEACQNARTEMARTGAEVIERTTQEVVTELVLSPVEPVSAGGIALKEAAGEALQAGMTVLSSTSQCASSPPASGCKIGITQTNGAGEARAPAGELQISISGQGIARIELDRVELAPDEVLDIVLDLVGIDEDEPRAGAGGAGGEGGGGASGVSGAGAGGGAMPGSCSHPDAEGTHVPRVVHVVTPADVQALAGCTSVGGLDIGFDAQSVTSLAGLESLTEITMAPESFAPDLIDGFSGNVDIRGVPALTDIGALANLTRVAGGLRIDAPLVREVDLHNLQSVGADPMSLLPGLSIGGELLASIDLSNLDAVVYEARFGGGELDTLLVPKITEVMPNAMGATNGFYVFGAEQLAVLELPELSSLEGDLVIDGCDALTAIQAPKLSAVSRQLTISFNGALTTIGLDTITSPVGGIDISTNGSLRSIGLNGIPSVVVASIGGSAPTTGSMFLDGDPMLEELGFAALASIEGMLRMGGTNLLTTEEREAFESRVAVGGN